MPWREPSGSLGCTGPLLQSPGLLLALNSIPHPTPPPLTGDFCEASQTSSGAPSRCREASKENCSQACRGVQWPGLGREGAHRKTGDWPLTPMEKSGEAHSLLNKQAASQQGSLRREMPSWHRRLGRPLALAGTGKSARSRPQVSYRPTRRRRVPAARPASPAPCDRFRAEAPSRLTCAASRGLFSFSQLTRRSRGTRLQVPPPRESSAPNLPDLTGLPDCELAKPGGSLGNPGMSRVPKACLSQSFSQRFRGVSGKF